MMPPAFSEHYVFYDYNEIKYFMGLGGCEQALGNYKKAADIYSLASVVSGLVDPEPMYYAAVCLLKAGEKRKCRCGS